MSNVNPVQGSLITWTPTVVQEMDRHEYDEWQMRRGSNDPSVFASTFQSNNISFEGSVMNLSLDNEGCPATCAGRPYASGEYRSLENSGYGYYEVRMRPAAGSGLVSTFFTHRGTSGGSSHDEIDFEFLGLDTRRVQLNYFVEGEGNHEKYIDLDFDASQAFHHYGFRWSPESLIWYIDGQEVYRVEEDPDTQGHEIPYRPGRITANFWAGTNAGWAGAFSYPGHPLSAEFDWIKYSTLEAAAGAPAATPTVTPRPTSAICPEPIERSILYVPDPEIGIMKEDGRAELRLIDIADKVDYRQVEEIVNALTGAIPDNRIINPDIAWQSLDENHKLYPELGRILELDEQCSYQFYRYFNDSRTYWDNAITLLSVYVQMSLERNELDKMEYALEMVDRFRARIASQELADQASPTRISSCPSSYKMAQLGLVEAEIRSQIQSADMNYYIEGVNTALDSVAVMLSLQYDTEYPSAPDYFGIAKAILTLGNLYMQIANLTKEEKYFEAAHQLFQSLAGLRSEPSVEVGIRIDLGRLFRDPLLLENDEKVDFTPDPYGLFSSAYEINAGPREIYEALKFNLEQKYILPQDIDNAMIGVFHYLKGVSLIADTNLLIAWSRTKKIDEVLINFENVNRGIEELRKAAEWSGRGEEKIRYYLNLAKVVKGNLFLALADRINFYSENPDLSDQPLLPLSMPNEIDQVLIEAGLTVFDESYDLSVALIEAAREKYFTDIPEDLKYLRAWSLVKLLEITIRLAEYVNVTRQGRIADGAEMLGFADQISPLVEELCRLNPAVEYLGIEFNYLHTIPLLLGTVFPLPDGTFETAPLPYGETGIKRESQSYDALAVLEQLEGKILSLPPSLYTYFKVYIKLKEVIALTQIFYDLKMMNIEKNRALDSFLREHSPKYKYQNGTLLIDGRMTPEELTALLSCYSRQEDKDEIEKLFQLTNVVKGFIERSTGQEIPPREYQDRLVECALNLLREVESETAPAIPSYLWINVTRTLPELLGKEQLTQKEKKQLADIPKALIRFIFGVSEKLPENQKLKQFVQQHASKYRYENGMLMVNGQVTAEEKNALLACFSPEENRDKEEKDKIEQLFRRSRGAREFPPSLIEKVLALRTEISEARVDREACKNILDQVMAELTPLYSSNTDFLDYNVEIAAWDVHSLYAELYHGFALIYGTLSHGRAAAAPESDAFWQYAQSAYLESTWSYSPYDRNHRPFFLFKLVKHPDDTVAELAELKERMRSHSNSRRASSHE